MEIVLLRHGRPLVDMRTRISSAAYGGWIAQYDSAGLDPESRPPPATVRKARECDYVICSHLPRSVESAYALGLTTVDVADALYREFEMPYLDWRSLKLSPNAWSGFYRLLWIAGFSPNVESFQAGRRRAQDCAARLTGYARHYGRVIFVGHGALHWYVSRQLLASGWSNRSKEEKGFWGFRVFHCNDV